MSASWWADVAMRAPAELKVFVGSNDVRVEYASVTTGVRGGVSVGAAVAVWTLIVVIVPGAALPAIAVSLAASAAGYRWLSRPTRLRLDETGLSVEDPIRGKVVVRWEDVREVVLQEAVPADEGSDRGLPASVRVERQRPPLGSSESLRLGIPVSDEGRAWLLTLITMFWRTAQPYPQRP